MKLTKGIIAEADHIVRGDTIPGIIAEASLQNLGAIIAAGALKHRGWYGYREVDQGNRKVLLILEKAMDKKKRYAEDGTRLTDCCGAYSTYDEGGELYCKKCFQPVGFGQGDGTERKGGR